MKYTLMTGLVGVVLFTVGCDSVTLTGLVYRIEPKYLPTGSFSSIGITGPSLKIEVVDKRPKPIMFRGGDLIWGPLGIGDKAHLSCSSVDMLEVAFHKALDLRGYDVNGAAPTSFAVGIEEISVYCIALDISVRRGDQVFLRQTVTEYADPKKGSGFQGVPGQMRFNRLMSLTVDKALSDPKVATAFREASGVQAVSATQVSDLVEESRYVPSMAVWVPDDRRCLWVLAIGVGQYRDLQVPALPYARSDAEHVRKWFTNLGITGMKSDNVHVLFDEQATRENLLSQIDWVRRKALPEDLVFVYFAGHGAPELAPDGTNVDAKYLVLYDTNPDQLYATGFPLDELTRRLDGVKAKTQVVILEACYAGPVGQEVLKKTPTADLEIKPRLIQQLGEKGGRVILSASSGRQMALGSEEIKGGLFTHYLLNAWGDGSDRLLSEQFDEAKYQVRRASNQLGSLQEPAKFGDQNVDVILKLK